MTKTRSLTRKSRSNTVLPYLLILPAVIFLVTFLFYPMIRALINSFFNYQRTKPKQYGFIGLENYKALFEDEELLPSLLISLKWVVTEVGLQAFIGLVVALLLNRKMRFQGVLRTITFIPWAISGVLTGILWMLIFDDNFGLINNVLKMLNLMPRSWLGNTSLAFPSVVIAELWRGIPFLAITILAALQTIPEEVYESAKIDGAGRATVLFRITLPLVKESIMYATLMRCIWAFQSVDLIMTMTNGGPLGVTRTFALYMYETSVTTGNYGYGSTLAMLSFVILIGFTIVYLKANSYGMED